MKAKRILAVLVAVGLVALLLPGTVYGSVTLTFRHWGPNFGIDGTWQLFNESQDEVEIVFDHVGAGYMDKLMLEIAAGEGPDLFSLQGWETAEMNMGAWVRDGMLLDVTPYWERDRHELQGEAWYPFITEMASYRGKLAGLPYAWSIFNAVEYNIDMFDEAGMMYPDDSWTWSTLFDASRKFMKFDSDGKVVRKGLNLGDIRWWTTETMIRSAGGRVFNDSQTALELNSRPALEAMRKALRFITEGAALEEGGGFLSGTQAMRASAIHWSTAQRLEADLPFASSLTVTPLDAETGVRAGNLVELMLTGINPNTRNPEAAWEAMKFFTRNYARGSLKAWGLVQMIPVTSEGVDVFLHQDASVLGEKFVKDLEMLVPAMAGTARLPLEYKNPKLVDVYPDIKHFLDQEWFRVLREEIPIYQFIENVNSRFQSELQR